MAKQDGTGFRSGGVRAPVVAFNRPGATLAGAEALGRLLQRMPLIYLITDADSCVTFVAGGGLELVERSPESVVGRSFFEVLGALDRTDRFRVAFESARAGTSEHLHASNFGRSYEAFLEPVRGADDRIEGVVMLALDQTESRAIGRALRRSDANVGRAQRLAALGSWVHYPETRETFVSEEMRRLFDYPPSRKPDVREFLERIHPGDRASIAESLRRALHARQGDSGRDYRIVCADGTTRWARQQIEVICTRAGAIAEICGTVLDITERKLMEEHLRQLAHFDALTGLANRLSLQEQLAATIADNAVSGRAMAVLFIDVDRFKTVNDTLGHRAGDQLLQLVGKRILHCLRGSDFIARVGGDEFVILVSPLGEREDAANLARRIAGSCSSPYRIEERELFCSLSIGISTLPGDATTAEEALRNADAAMYAAKSAGRNGHAFYDAGMHAAAADRLLLENELRRAIERDELFIEYQPIVRADGSLATLEALVRWQHPERGVIGPGSFIPIAEESGSITALGLWVLRAACGDLRDFRRFSPELRVAVNLSARQFDGDDLLPAVTAVLHGAQLDFSALEFEITESVVMADIEHAVRTLHTIKALGARVSIDDFGTGYSSLAALKRLPLDTLKIDRSFIEGTPQDRDDLAIVTAIVGIGQTLDLCVVAEGVETKEQLDYLRAIGCDAMQGYYLARPMRREAVFALLDAPPLPAGH